LYIPLAYLFGYEYVKVMLLRRSVGSFFTGSLAHFSPLLSPYNLKPMKQPNFQTDLTQLQKEDLITEVIGELKSGKEATVHLVKKDDQYLALKHYRPMWGRHYANTATYRQGRHLSAHDARAFAKKTNYGKRLSMATWIAAEFKTIRQLSDANLPVPKPIAHLGSSILMEFIADEPDSESPAPRMIDVQLTAEEAHRFHAILMRSVIAMMKINIVHADLSEYNVLIRSTEPNHREPIIIDFPQSVDPRSNNTARELLQHDIETITNHCQRYNKTIKINNLTTRLWRQFEDGSL